MKVLSWNIGGGHTLLDGQEQDGSRYDKEDIQWFLKQIENKDYDIVCLQEAHIPHNETNPSQIQKIADVLKYVNYEEHGYGDSFIKAENWLSFGNVSRYPIEESYSFTPPNPKLTITRPNGDVWKTYDFGFFVSKVRYQGIETVIINSHLIPFHYFDRNFKEPEFKPVRDAVIELFKQYSTVPTLALGDYNYENLQEVLPEIYLECEFKDVFTNVETAPCKGQQDHILYSKHWKVNNYDIIKGRSDHHQCVADLELK